MRRPATLGSRSLGAALATCILLVGAVAYGATPEELFQQGREAMSRGDYATACAAFEASYAESHSTSKGALYNLAQCEDEGHRGRLATSLQRWKEVRERLTDKPELVAEAERRVAYLESRAARLGLKRGPSLSPSAVPSVDGKAAPFDAPIALDAGLHTVTVNAGGREQRLEVRLIDGEKQTLVLEGEAPAAGGPPPTNDGSKTAATPTDDASGLRIAAFAAGGVGLAGLALFGISIPIQAGAADDLDAACPTRSGCGPEAEAPADRGTTWQVVGGVGLGVGLLGLGLGATFFLLGSSEDTTAITTRGDGMELRVRF